ncbi:Tim44/TimA family putative adaptor protein [Roseobacter sp. HKCCA2468]|uniref:Tim44/TimA family putative adaptor protein n=1 Tax=Roseobacter sp. HKCCA2468 TaxID=3120342 RepID=UPI0030ED6218
MNSSFLSLLVLAAIAIFLILRLRAVLGTREGFEKSPEVVKTSKSAQSRNFEVIEGGPDRDITDHVPEGSESARALAAMKSAEPSFAVGEFLTGARGAYEMILMAFERGDISEVRDFLSPEVAESFDEVIEARRAQGLEIEANFVGLNDIAVQEAQFDATSREGEVTVRFAAELTSVVRNSDGEIVEGSATEIKRQRDVWTFAREMGSRNPNWVLVATGA